MDLKMEVYSPFLELLGLLEIQNSVIWERKAFSSGSFSLTSLITEESQTLLVPENIIWIAGEDAGIIEYVQEEAGEDGPYITVKGSDLTGALGRYILWGPYSLNGPVPALMYHLVDSCCINPTGDHADSRVVPNLRLSAIPAGGASIRTQKTGGNLLEALEALGETYQVPFGVRFVPEVPCMEFWARYGVNRSIHQTANNPVFYSTELDDVLSSEYSYNAQNWRNVALVAGEGEGKDRVTVTVTGNVEDTPEPPAPPQPSVKYTVTLSVDPQGGGLATGGGEVEAGKQITITATPATGYSFVGWQENGGVVSTSDRYTFPVTTDRTLTAVFAVIVPTYTISVSIDPAGSGTVSGAGAYEEGQTVTLTAAPGEDYKFSAWQENGETVSKELEYTFPASSDRALVAVFAVVPTSRLPEGYTELEYIQTDEKCKINTGFVVNGQTTKIVLDLEPIAVSDRGGYILTSLATKISSSKAAYFQFYATSSGVICYYACSNSLTNSQLTLPIQRFVIDFDFPNKRVAIGDNEFTLATSSYSNSNLIIGEYGASYDRSVSFKLYSCKIYTSGVLVRDLVPCTSPAGKPGLYDLMENTFFENTDTGTLTPGPAV